jgi:hypothetical protein
LDLTAGDVAARVTDYKTGAPPTGAPILDGGAELQRVLYAAAVRHHRPDARVMADLVFLGAEVRDRVRLPDADSAMTEAARHLNVSVELLRQGVALPGPDASLDWNPLSLALPAVGEPYFQIKKRAFDREFGALMAAWNAQ